METTENELLELSKDFKDRFEIKTNEIKELKKLLFMIYGLVRRGLETEDNAFF